MQLLQSKFVIWKIYSRQQQNIHIVTILAPGSFARFYINCLTQKWTQCTNKAMLTSKSEGSCWKKHVQAHEKKKGASNINYFGNGVCAQITVHQVPYMYKRTSSSNNIPLCAYHIKLFHWLTLMKDCYFQSYMYGNDILCRLSSIINVMCLWTAMSCELLELVSKKVFKICHRKLFLH